MRKKNQLHKRLETCKVQEWKQRGRPSPAATPLAGKHLLLGGCRAMKEKGKEKWEMKLDMKNITKEHKQPSLTFKTTPFAGKAVRRRRKEKNSKTHTPTDLTCASRVCGEKRKMKQNEEALWGRSSRIVSGWGEKNEKKNNGEWSGWHRAREKEKRVKQILF